MVDCVISVLILLMASFTAGLALTVFDDPSFVAVVGASGLGLVVWCMLR